MAFNVPSPKKRIDQDAIKAFAEASERPREPLQPIQTHTLTPWEGLRNEKPTETFLLRLTEKEAAMLGFIAENSKDSRQQFVRRVLIPAIESKAIELTNT